MKYVMAMTVLALTACGGPKNRPPPNEPVSTTQTTSAALTVPETIPAQPGSTAPDLRDEDKQAPNAPVIAAKEKDRTLGTKIRQHLARTLGDTSWNRVRMEIEDGHVRLIGELPTLADSTDVEHAVREVKGVTSVDNEIRLSAGRLHE